jgi:hypothetical protein
MTEPRVKRVHIVGCHRSGTSLMFDLLTTCFAVDSSGKLEMSIYEEPPQECDVYVTKQPRDIRIIKPILDADPNLFVVYLVRDPRDVIVSKVRSISENYFCNLGIWMECDDAAGELAGHPRFLTVRYESLVQDPDAIQRQIIAAFPFLQKKHSFSEFERFSNATNETRVAMSGLRPIQPDRLQAWRSDLPRIKAQMALHPGLTQRLIAHRYEPDESWTRILDEVQPVFTPSHRPDRTPLLQHWDWKLRNWWKRSRKLRRVRRQAAAPQASAV